MKAKFTSGEWSQSHRKDNNGMYSTEVYDDKGDTICTLAWHAVDEGNGVTSTDRDANAHLIAAAPDMYKMIDELIKLGTELLNVDEITDEEDAATVHSNFNDKIIKALHQLKIARGES